MSLYKEILLDHFKNPRYQDQGQIEHPSFIVLEANPLCGDFIQIKGQIIGDRLVQVVFNGTGCVISQGVASILLEKYHNQTIAEILALDHQDMLDLIGIELGPNRIKCALLALMALQNGIKNCSGMNLGCFN